MNDLEPLKKYLVNNSGYMRINKETLLGQKSFVIWMVGLSGSGKSTLAKSVEKTLHEDGYLIQVLDGDNLRGGINSDLGFCENERKENIRRTAEIAKLFLSCGVITICSLISPTKTMREIAKSIIGEEDFLEVFINCPLEECERRDVKGLYKLARTGKIKCFTGVDAPFEIPPNPSIEIRTHQTSIDESTDELIRMIYNKIAGC